MADLGGFLGGRGGGTIGKANRSARARFAQVQAEARLLLESPRALRQPLVPACSIPIADCSIVPPTW